MNEAARAATKAWVFAAPGDPARMHLFADVLNFHRIATYKLTADVAVDGQTYSSSDALIVPTTQAQRMVRHFPVYIELPEEFPDELKRVGMAASIFIHTEQQSRIVGGVAGIMQEIKASLDAVL